VFSNFFEKTQITFFHKQIGEYPNNFSPKSFYSERIGDNGVRATSKEVALISLLNNVFTKPQFKKTLNLKNKA
jgi:hypothetical protein